MTLTTETGNQNLVVLLNVVQATVTGHECGNLLAVLDELHSHTLADGRVGLFGFNATAKAIKKGFRLVAGVDSYKTLCLKWIFVVATADNSQYNPVI